MQDTRWPLGHPSEGADFGHPSEGADLGHPSEGTDFGLRNASLMFCLPAPLDPDLHLFSKHKSQGHFQL